MVALRKREALRPRSARRGRYSFSERLTYHYWQIAQDRQPLYNISTIVRNDAELYPLQCQAAITRLTLLRASVQKHSTFLDQLEPAMTERLRPYACIAKLDMLDYRLTEVIVTLAMFAPISQVVCEERIPTYLKLRSLFPALLATYEDTLSQLAVLMSVERYLRAQQDQCEGRRAGIRDE